MKVAWITGASSGIGEALSVAYAAESCRLVLSARREDELMRVKSRCLQKGLSDEDVLVLPLDVTREADMPAAVEQVLEHFGQIDLLINNAGISQRSLFVDTEVSVYRTIFDVDVIGPIEEPLALGLESLRPVPNQDAVEREPPLDVEREVVDGASPR